jgi:hypothetical protein
MAEKKKEHESEGKKGKKHLRAITTHKTDKPGVFVHEHHYTDPEGGNPSSSYGGVSDGMEDLQQHMQDQLGPGAADEGGGGGPADAAGAAPAGGAGAAPPPAGGQ